MELEVHPLGEVQNDENVTLFIQSMSQKWDEAKPKKKRFWNKIKPSVATKFLIYVLDAAVIFVSSFAIQGADKKATVLHIFERVFDNVIKEMLPFWIRPLAKVIKTYVLGYLISCIIDWMIEKYKNGSWRQEVVKTE